MKIFLAKLWARLRGQPEFEGDLREEMNAHLEFEIEDRIDRGMTPEHAHQAAVREFGNSTRIAEEARHAWRWTWLDQLCQDLAYGVRVLWHSPMFTVSAVGVLALGIGANLTTFHILN